MKTLRKGLSLAFVLALLIGVLPFAVFNASAESGGDGAPDSEADSYIIELAKGATGEAVANLQERLVSLRYLQDYTLGVFDDNTEQALKEFQSVNGRSVTGVLSRGDKKLLFSDKALCSREADNLRLGFTGTDVSVLKMKLAKLGYYKGEINELYDLDTEEAVKAFESDNGLSVTGVATLGVRYAIDAKINDVNYITATAVSNGNIWIITGIAVVVIGGGAAVVFVIYKKKKNPALAEGETTEEKTENQEN